MVKVETGCCGLKSDKYKLTCQHLAQHDLCPGLEGYPVTVQWNMGELRWKFTDPDLCVSFLNCSEAGGRYTWEAEVDKKIQGRCLPVLSAGVVTGTPQMPSVLPANGGFCLRFEGSEILVEAVDC